jgi:hypothetical protein
MPEQKQSRLEERDNYILTLEGATVIGHTSAMFRRIVKLPACFYIEDV